VDADDDAAVRQVRPILDAMGSRVFRTGTLGTGHAMKALSARRCRIGLAQAGTELGWHADYSAGVPSWERLAGIGESDRPLKEISPHWYGLENMLRVPE
jgi:hypothetical protein